MRTLLALISLSVMLLVAACSSPPENENGAAQNQNGRRRVVRSKERGSGVNAGNTMIAFKKAGIPVTNQTAYNKNTDPEKRLARPNMYIEKIGWVDDRVAPEGGIIEVFLSEDDLQQRKQALESEQAAAGTTEHMLTRINILVRLSKNLSSEQVAEYQTALEKAY